MFILDSIHLHVISEIFQRNYVCNQSSQKGSVIYAQINKPFRKMIYFETNIREFHNLNIKSIHVSKVIFYQILN